MPPDSPSDDLTRSSNISAGDPPASRPAPPDPATAATVPLAAPTRRRYDLDALRGFAMLLGIGLHAAIPFVAWRGHDDAGGWLLDVFVGFVHGFRMPLFFLISGYFTTMLWRRRGLRSLVRHRLRRIGLPLLVGCFTIIPAVWIGIIAGLLISGETTWEELEGGDGVGAYEEQLEDDLDAGIDAGDRDAGSDALRAAGHRDATDSEEEFGFAHLWFLWVLLWQVAGFAAVASLLGRRCRSRGGHVRAGSPRASAIVMWSLPVLAVVPQMMMVEGGFGPDTSESFIPAPHVLVYYACFFGFGALAYDHRDHRGAALMDVIGRRWILQLAVAAVVMFPAGIALEDAWAVSALLQIAFAWTMSFGLIGLFRRFMSRASFGVWYLSDASYWMYLAHLPLVFVAQGLVALLPLPALVDFALMCAATTALLLLAYRYIVRYSFIGTLLNGHRNRDTDRRRRADLTRVP